MSTETDIERLILDELLPGKGRTRIDPDDSLFGLGILDSLAFLRLIALLEKQFAVTIEDGEVIPENFETINRIKAFVERKRGKN